MLLAKILLALNAICLLMMAGRDHEKGAIQVTITLIFAGLYSLAWYSLLGR
jgi:hypothetical protein